MRFYGSAPAAADVNVITLSDAPNGFWTDIPDQKWAYDATSDQTFYTWVDGATGDIKVAAYNHSTGTKTTPFVLHAALGGVAGNPDLHDSPALLVRSSDRRLIVAYSAHQGTQLYVRISTNVADATAWGSETNIDSSVVADQYTYPGLLELTSEGKIYIWWRELVYSTNLVRHSYSTSADNGATWSAGTKVWVGDNTTALNYRRLTTNGTDRIDGYFTDNARTLAAPSSLYHIYFTGGTWYKSDGTPTGKSSGHGPADATLVKGTGDGPASSLGAGYDGSTPVTLVQTYDASTVTVWQARWDGAAWDLVEIGETGGLATGSNPFVVGAALDRDDVDTCWFPVLVSGKFELYRWDSPDSGATWDPTPVTSGSIYDNLLPDAVWHHSSEIKVIWGYGTFTDNSTFDLGIRGGY